jgi:putative flippase GtrA
LSILFRDLFLQKSDKTMVHLLRSIFSSNIAFSVDFGLLALLTEVFHIHYLISAGIGFIIGTTVSYILSILWVFDKRRLRNKQLEYWVFIFIGLTGAVLNELLIWFFTEQVHIFYLISKIISGSSVFFYNFFMRRHFLFR